MRRWLTACVACLLSTGVLADHGVILMYHHVDDNTPASTSVTPAQFRRHLDYIEDNGFVVVPLTELLDSLYGDGAVPDNAVAITFDDAYQSIYREALPALESRNMPFTVFVATQAVDQKHDSSLTWEELRQLQASGLASFGAHSVTHEHLLRGSEHGITDAWTARVSREIDDSVARLEAQLPGVSVRSFAWPFGEYSEALQGVLASRGLFGLAQQSGAAGAGTPRTAIPRFPMATGYDSADRLAMALNTRPLPVSGVDAGAALIAEGEAMPENLHLRLPEEGPYRRDAIACYSRGDSLALRQEADTVIVSLPPLRAGRNRINCTAPSSERGGEFFWYSHQWVVADKEGAWLTY